MPNPINDDPASWKWQAANVDKHEQKGAGEKAKSLSQTDYSKSNWNLRKRENGFGKGKEDKLKIASIAAGLEYFKIKGE